MKASLINVAANTTLAATVGGGGILWWLDQHSAGLGALAVLIGIVLGGIFKLLGLRELKRHHKAIENPED